MIKHPGPWTFHPFGNIHDANKDLVCGSVTDDPETRTILLHAREMWEALRDIATTRPNSSGGIVVNREACKLYDKIKSEIAAARKP